MMRKVGVWIVAIVMVLAACTRDGDTSYVSDPDDQPSTTPIVTVIYDPGALGDMTYNDLIYEGVERAAIKYGLRTRQLSPSSKEEGMKYISAVFAELESARDTVRHLLIVPGVGYEEYLRANNRRLECNPNADLLFFETTEPFEGKGSTTLGNFIARSAGEPIYDNDTLHVYIGVDNIEEALTFWDDCLAPDIQRTVSAAHNYTYTLTDEEGHSQGTVSFAPGTESGHVAEITTNAAGLKHFKQITFLLNSAWPYNSETGKYLVGEAVVEMVNTIHHGENRGSKPVILYMFYLSQKDLPLAVQHPEIPLE